MKGNIRSSLMCCCDEINAFNLIRIFPSNNNNNNDRAFVFVAIVLIPLVEAVQFPKTKNIIHVYFYLVKRRWFFLSLCVCAEIFILIDSTRTKLFDQIEYTKHCVAKR